MGNLLEDWKNECYALSSELSIDRQLNRADVDRTYNILLSYFGIEFFNLQSYARKGIAGFSWIFTLLTNSKSLATISAIYEVADILSYLETLNSSIKKKFQQLLTDPRQFRDMFFELYTYRMLDFNKVENIKKPKEGKKELEGICIIEGKEFLFECRKLYAPDIKLLESIMHSLEKLHLGFKSLNKIMGMVGTIIIKKPNDNKIKENLTNKIDKFIEGFQSEIFHNGDYHDEDTFSALSVVNYSISNSIEIDSKSSQYHVTFKIIPPHTIVPGVPNHFKIDLKSNFSFLQYKVNRKLFSAITEKSEQHKDSIYPNKIYFIDNEISPDLDIHIFRLDSMFEEDKIKEFVNTLTENEIVCFIIRNYMGHEPKMLIKAFGKNIDIDIKRKSLRV